MPISTFDNAYGGLSWRFTKWLQMGAGAGADRLQTGGKAKMTPRFGSFASISGEDRYLFAIYEKTAYGGRSYHLVILNQAVSEKFGVGGLAQAYAGIGPRLEYNPWRSFKFWWALPFKSNLRPNFLIGMRYTFSIP